MSKTSNSPRILVAGIGNIFLGDDAFGVRVVQQLAHCKLPELVQVVDFGIRGLDLAHTLVNGYAATILVDAMPRGGEPGTLYLLEPASPTNNADNEAAPPAMQTHGLDPVKVLALAESLGARLDHVLVVGCEPMPLESEHDLLDGLSPAVAAAVQPAIERIESLVTEMLADPAFGDRKIQLPREMVP